MKALVKRVAQEGLWLEEVPVPEINDFEVLIKTRKTSICGTDLHIYKWDEWSQRTIPVPMTIGHEFVGEIAAVGKNVHHLKVGTRVCGEGHIVCGLCPNCKIGKKHLCMNTVGLGIHRSGCFAEYFALPAENVFVIPDSIPDSIAALLDPFGNAVHTALSNPLVGEEVLITGAGPIGIMAAAIAIEADAHHVVITDVNDYRLELAQSIGIQHTVNVSKTNLSEEVKRFDINDGFTVGMEMSGNPAAMNQILENSRHGAKVALLGILPQNTGINWDLVIFKMLTLKGIYGREIFDTWYKMIHLIERGLDLSPLITHHYRFDEFEKGFEAMLSGHTGKIILDWMSE